MKGEWKIVCKKFTVQFWRHFLSPATEPSDDKKKEIRRAGSFETDSNKKNALIVQKLKEAAHGDAVWVKKAEPVKNESSQQQQQQQPSKREIN